MDLQRYITIQLKEIQEHKWYLSERYGRDVGDHEAVYDWSLEHAARFEQAFVRNVFAIYRACNERCGEGCGGLEKCTLTKQEIHVLLND